MEETSTRSQDSTPSLNLISSIRTVACWPLLKFAVWITRTISTENGISSLWFRIWLSAKQCASMQCPRIVYENKTCKKNNKSLTTSSGSSMRGLLNIQFVTRGLLPIPNSRAVSSIDARKALESLEAAGLEGDVDDHLATRAGRGRGTWCWERGKTKLAFITLKLGAEKAVLRRFQTILSRGKTSSISRDSPFRTAHIVEDPGKLLIITQAAMAIITHSFLIGQSGHPVPAIRR